MPTTKKSKKAAPKKKKAAAKRPRAKAPSLRDLTKTALSHPVLKGKKTAIHSVSFKLADPDHKCVQYKNETTVTTDAAGNQIVTTQPVCVRWSDDD